MRISKVLKSVYLFFLASVIVLAFLWGLPIYRYLKNPVQPPAMEAEQKMDPQLEAAIAAASLAPEEKTMDPRSLLGVNPAMIPKFESIVQRVAPDSAPAWVGLGILYQYKNRLEDAQRCYRKAIELDPEFPDAHYRLGTAYQAQHKLLDAITEYRAAMRVKSNYLFAYYSLAAVYQEQQKNEDAIWLYHEILRMDPKQYQAHNNLGIIFEGKGQYEQALKEYARAAALNPHDPTVENNLKMAQRELGSDFH